MADVTLPQLGETVTEGTITQWFKQVGDTVAADEPLFEVSTDKVDTEVPSPVAGTLTEIRVQEGETVDVGTVIAVVGDGDGAPAAAEPPAAEEAPAEEAARRAGPEPEAGGGTEAPAVELGRARAGTASAAADRAGRAAGRRAGAAEPEPAPAPPAAPSAAKGILLSPVVRRLVNEHGLDPAAITGTGPGGRITRDDVLDHIDTAGSKPAATPPRRPSSRSRPTRHRRPRPRRPPARPRRRRRAPPPRRPRPSRRASATPRSSCPRSASSPAPTC